MTIPAMPGYRVNPVVRLRWHAWDDEVVAFEELSGEASALGAIDGAVFACIEEGIADDDRIIDAVASDLGVSADAELATEVKGSVEQFLARGWIEALSSR